MKDIGYVPRLTRPTSCLRNDGVTPWELRGEKYEAPYRGLRRPAGLSADQPALRVADAIGLMTSGCVLTGWASRLLQGQAYCDGELYDGDLPVVVLAVRSRESTSPTAGAQAS